MAPARVLLFGDQTVEKTPAIRQLFHSSRSSPPLRRFLQDSSDVIQKELSDLSAETRKSFGAFDSILSLAEKFEGREDRREDVPTTLMTVARLGNLILHVENDPSLLSRFSHSTHFLGLCTGLLPALAAACANTAHDLHVIGLAIVAISVRLGDEIAERTRLVESTPGTWGYSIVGATESQTQKIIDAFHYKKRIPQHKRAFIGVISRTWTTVFGPPTTLAELWKFSPDLNLAPRMKLHAQGAVHASHLPPLDIDRIIGNASFLNCPYPESAMIISSSTIKPYVASDTRSALEQMTVDVAKNPLHLTETVQALVSKVSELGRQVDLYVIGPTAHTRALQNAFQESSVTVNTILEPKASSVPATLREGSGKVAIVGMSGRFPGSENLQEFWDSLRDGAEFHEKVPPSRFELSQFYDPTGVTKGTMTTEHGCFLRNPGHFDCRLFNISPREAMQMEPVSRLLLMASYEALEMAGYSPGRTPSSDAKRIATFMAQTTDDWRSINEQRGVDIYYVPAGIRAFTPGRINYHFKWEGPSHSIDAACSGSSTSVQLACSALLSRECDTALAGGGQINATPWAFAGCGRGGFLSPTGGCKTFRDDADGYCRGEGVGVVVLKRLEDAIADNDNVLGLISASMRTYSAGAASITQPHGDSQVSLCNSVLQQAGTDPQEIGYVEMHGTGTQSGDFCEMQSISKVFGGTRPPDSPLVVGAVKANVGHSEAGAGVTSLIKCILMLQRGGSIPPQPGMPFKLNHKFPQLDKLNIKIANGKLHLKAHATTQRKKILLNNFDASGGNTCLVIEQHVKPQPKTTEDPRSCHIVVVSARTSRSLRENKKRLLDFLTVQNAKLADIAYSTTARRMQDSLRASYVASTVQELQNLVAKDLEKTKSSADTSHRGIPSIAFAFTGQGALSKGMGTQLFKSLPAFRASILSFQRICDSQGLPQVAELIATGQLDAKTTGLVQSQLAILFIELALHDLFKAWGICPTVLIGHSLGEYAAMCVAGVLSTSDTIHLVGARSRLVEQNCVAGSQAMLSVNASPKAVASALDSESLAYEISCINAPNMTVISGDVDVLQKVQRTMETSNTKTKLLQMPFGFHSAQMDPILEGLETAAKGITFSKPRIAIASTLTGNIVSEVGTFDAAYLVRQAREPVNFVKALRSIKNADLIDSHSLWYEIGPEPVCMGLVRSTLDVHPSKLLPALKSSEHNWSTLSNCISAAYLANVAISWPNFHRDYEDGLTMVSLPTYSFDVKNYWDVYRKETAPEAPTPIGPLSQPPSRKRLGATTLQYVEEECFDKDEARVVLSAHTDEEKLFAAIQGHQVDNTAICPASVFCDMALTAAKYIYMVGTKEKIEPEMAVSDLEITHPLVATTKNPDQSVQVTAIKPASNAWTSVWISFSSTDGITQHQHGSCIVQFGRTDPMRTEFSRTLPLVLRRMDDLNKSAAAGLSYHLQRPILYKLFANLVDYSQEYQGLDEISLDPGYQDAVAKVKLQDSSNLGTFTLNPYWMDAVVHLAGFLLNGNINLPKEIAYIAAGFEKFYVYEKLSPENTYLSYVSTQPGRKKDVVICDVYVFHGVRLVALCTGLNFHKMTRKVLRIIFGIDEKVPTQSSMTLPQHVPKPPTLPQHVMENALIKEGAKRKEPKAAMDVCSTRLKTTDLASTVLQVVAAECGFEMSEIEPSTKFADIGMDSLMSIAVSSAVKKKTGAELGANFFNDHPTVEDVRKEIGSSVETVQESNKTLTDFEEQESTLASDGSALANSILSIVASECGFETSDVQPSTSFADLGIDSLMSIAITSRVQKVTGVELGANFFNEHPTIADLMNEFSTASKLPNYNVGPASESDSEESLDADGITSEDESVETDMSQITSSEDTPVCILTPNAEDSGKQQMPHCEDLAEPMRDSIGENDDIADQTPDEEPVQFSSNAVLIRGRSSSKDAPLFMVADGAGSATAYIHLPPLATGNRIYALESPFLHDPQSYKCSVEEVSRMYLATIRRVCPQGPYLVGGWSAGAIYAYEITRQLSLQGETILGLILIDMRVPRKMPDALEPSRELIESAGVFTGINRNGSLKSAAATRLKEHLLSTISALVDYDPIPMAENQRPKQSFIIWAQRGLSESRAEDPFMTEHFQDRKNTSSKDNVMEDAETGLKSWFYDSRSAFGPNGWDRLLGKVECHLMEDADHFDMVVPPKVKKLGKIMSDAVGKCMQAKR